MVSGRATELRAEFRRLRDRPALCPAETARLAQEAVRACLNSPGELEPAAALLCELATLPDPHLSWPAVEGLFRHVVEEMADAFEPRLCDAYTEFFARVLEYCRGLPQASWLNERLCGFNLHNRQDLIRRARALRVPRPVSAGSTIRKIVVLSRVTLGADVAVTSLVLAKMMRAFPEARLVFLAGERAALLFAGEPRVMLRRVEYPRGGGLLERLAAWPAVVDAVREELADLNDAEYLVVDPDSRLTQLGMLPVIGEESAYRFFESRSYQSPGLETLSELTDAWLTETFGSHTKALHPWLCLPADTVQFAREVRRSAPEQRCASVNFGVGDNPAKRIADPFEERLLLAMLDQKWRLVFDKGVGEEEIARAERLLAAMRGAGWQVADIREGSSPPPAGANVVAWEGSLAGFAALIGASDVHIGYDSACQHLAAALGTKTVDIFAGFRSSRMPQRWRPSGPGEVRMIVVEPDRPPDPDRLLHLVLEAAR